jgi:hypothetical protein
MAPNAVRCALAKPALGDPIPCANATSAAPTDGAMSSHGTDTSAKPRSPRSVAARVPIASTAATSGDRG